MISAVAMVLSLALRTHVDDCATDEEALRFRDAAVSCAAAVPEASATQLPAVYARLGKAFAVLGDDTRAKDAFASLLALDPQAQLPSSDAPRFRELLSLVRREGGGEPVRLEAKADPPSTQDRLLHVRIIDGPRRPVTRLLARAGAGETTAERGVAETRLTVPTDARRVTLSALDRFGGTLVREQVSLLPPRRWLVSWPAWTGLAGAFALTGGGLGLAASLTSAHARAESAALTARADQASAQREATAANVSYGLAAGAAVTALVFLFVERGS